MLATSRLAAILLCAAGLCTAAAPALADLPIRSTSQATPNSTTAKPTTRYCVRETPTGSHITRTTCKTRAQWIAEDKFDPLEK